MKLKFIAAAALMAVSLSSQAAVTTTSLASEANATVIGFEGFDGLVNTTGSVYLGQGVTFSGATDAELAPPVRDLGDNGLWTFGLNGFAASGSDGVLTFSFSNLMSGVTAFISHNAGETVLVEALGVGGSVLESTTVSFASSLGWESYDEGTTIGFVRNDLDIQALRITGVGAVADTVSAVPEPETYAMLLAGLGLMGAVARRRRQA